MMYKTGSFFGPMLRNARLLEKLNLITDKMSFKRAHGNLEISLIVVLIIYNLFLLFFAADWVFTSDISRLVPPAVPPVKDVQHMVPLMNLKLNYIIFYSGVLGGSFYCLRSVYLRLSIAYPETLTARKIVHPARSFNVRVWFFWFVYRPFQGGILALVIICLINGKFLAGTNLSADGLNSIYTSVAVGFFAGFGSHEVIQKVQEIIAVVFAKSRAAEQSS